MLMQPMVCWQIFDNPLLGEKGLIWKGLIYTLFGINIPTVADFKLPT